MHLKVISLVSVMTMYSVVSMDEVIRYFRGITIHTLIYKYDCHVIIDIINRVHSTGQHKGAVCALIGVQFIIRTRVFFLN